jgi:hypothetical protein
MPDFPPGWTRTPTYRRDRARFDSGLTIARAYRDLTDEVSRARGHDMRVDHDIKLRRDGAPYSNQRQPDDPGVVVYFRRAGKPIVFACDRWDRVEHNMRAIQKTLEAKRGIERWGAATGEREFAGYEALPPGTNGATQEGPYQVLGVAPDAPSEVVRSAYRALALVHHPDKGGDPVVFQRIRRAYEEAQKGLVGRDA